MTTPPTPTAPAREPGWYYINHATEAGKWWCARWDGREWDDTYPNQYVAENAIIGPRIPSPDDPAPAPASDSGAALAAALYLSNSITTDPDKLASLTLNFNNEADRKAAMGLLFDLKRANQLTATPAPADWRDISTAPKDGMFLVANKLGEVCPMRDNVVLNTPGHADWTGGWATHWMPLPVPPTGALAAGGTETGTETGK